jgi:hypothetical protein
MTELFDLSAFRLTRGSLSRIYFNRSELGQLLALYSGQVARGVWRDYAIDHTSGLAGFSVFRHAHERPLFTVIKRGGGGTRPYEYALVQDRKRLAKAADLNSILTTIRRTLIMQAPDA